MTAKEYGEITTVFEHLGKTGDAVEFDLKTMTVTFNLDCGFIKTMYAGENANMLAAIAAGHIAHAITDGQEEFSRVFSTMLERHILQEATR